MILWMPLRRSPGYPGWRQTVRRGSLLDLVLLADVALYLAVQNGDDAVGTGCQRRFMGDLTKVICLLFFVLLPTHNVRPPLETGGFTGWAMRTIWLLDTPTNLFPSIHCFVSWLGTRYIYECRSFVIAA